jgi:hypothetical protein
MNAIRAVLSAVLLASCAAGGGQPVPPGFSPRSQSDLEQWQSLTEEQRSWATQHPEAAGAVGKMSPEEREQMLQQFKNLPPGMQQQIREHPEQYMNRR